MKLNPEDHWSRLAGAARRVARDEPVPEPDRSEIRRRIEDLQERLRHLFLTWLWRRWSLIAILAALIAYAAFYLALHEKPAEPPTRPQLPLPPPP